MVKSLPANRLISQAGPVDEERISLRRGGVVHYPTVAYVVQVSFRILKRGRALGQKV